MPSHLLDCTGRAGTQRGRGSTRALLLLPALLLQALLLPPTPAAARVLPAWLDRLSARQAPQPASAPADPDAAQAGAVARVAVEAGPGPRTTAVLETPRECRLYRHHPGLATFVETRLPAFPTLDWAPVGVDPRLVFLGKGDAIAAVVRIAGKSAREIEDILAQRGTLPL
eukprot:jgi/Tetstr1/432461/TSEL_021837.t1